MTKTPLRLLFVTALLVVPLAARADPLLVTAYLAPYIGGTAAAAIGTVAGFIGTYGAYIAAVAWAPCGTAASRRDARRKAAERQADADNTGEVQP